MARLLVYILELVFALIIGRLISRRFQSAANRTRRDPGYRPRRQPSKETMHTVRDPVCGTFVSTEVSHQLKWDGQVLHFCSQECLEQFQRHPAHAG